MRFFLEREEEDFSIKVIQSGRGEGKAERITFFSSRVRKERTSVNNYRGKKDRSSSSLLQFSTKGGEKGGEKPYKK